MDGSSSPAVLFGLFGSSGPGSTTSASSVKSCPSIGSTAAATPLGGNGLCTPGKASQSVRRSGMKYVLQCSVAKPAKLSPTHSEEIVFHFQPFSVLAG